MRASRRTFLLLTESSLAVTGLSPCTGRAATPQTTPSTPPSTVGLDLESMFAGAIAATGMAGCRQLLAMRSGIFDFAADEKFLQAFTADPTTAWTLQDTIGVILRNQPLVAPSEAVSCCDSNYALQGAIGEPLDRAPLHEIVTRRILSPLGLEHTYYPTDTTIRDPHPTPFVPQLTADGASNGSAELRAIAELDPAVPAGAGAVISTLDDVSTRTSIGTEIAIVGNESTNATTPTLSIAVATINAIDPIQGTGP